MSARKPLGYMRKRGVMAGRDFLQYPWHFDKLFRAWAKWRQGIYRPEASNSTPFAVSLKRLGAPGRIRTRDPLITNQMLYQLSYKGIGHANYQIWPHCKTKK